jgi:signal transduction histidine kinase
MKKALAEVQTAMASRVAHEIEGFIEGKVQRLRDLSTSAGYHEFGSEGQKLLALFLLKNDLSFTEVTFLDAAGMEVMKVSERRVYLPTERSNQSGSEKFHKAMKGESYVSSVYTLDGMEPHLTLAVPLEVPPKQVAGVVSAEINLKSLRQVISDIEFGHAGYAYLIDGLGNLIAHRDSSLIFKRRNVSHLHEVREFLSNLGGPDSTPAEEHRGLMGDLVISTYAPVTRVGWAIVLEQPVAAALAEQRGLIRYALLLFACGLLVGAVLIVLVSNKITRPIRVLHHGAQVIAEGNLDHRVDIKTGDEIEELAEEFNTMAQKLKASYSNLEKRVERRTHQLRALYSISVSVGKSLELDVILKEAIGTVLETLKFDAGRIFLLDREGKELQLGITQGLAGDSLKSPPYPLGEGVIGNVAKTGKALFFDDMQTDPQFRELARGRLSLDSDFHASVNVPITAKERVLGVLNLLSHGLHHLTRDELVLINSMASQIGVAIENASLFEESRAANQAKSEFMSAMSHELRTPLGVIIGNAELVQDGFFGSVTEKQGEALGKIIRYSQMLLKLINDLLTLNRMDAQKITLNLSTFNLEDVIAGVRTYVEMLNRENHNLQVLWKVEPDLTTITTDALKLEEILQNLIGNAFKFTPQGQIEVRVRDLQGKGRIEFAVADTGIGIGEEDRGLIFDEFHQLSKAHTGKHGGVGLGLSIVKRYLELMQGEIQVESQPGTGSTFTFTLPYCI